jgi:hypothetical protein
VAARRGIAVLLLIVVAGFFGSVFSSAVTLRYL